MSTLLRPVARREVWSGVSLLAGAAVREALLDAGVREVSLYWPNDLQVGSRKIGGVLGEVRSSGDKAWIALGIGINIDLRRAPDMPPELAASSTSMAEHGSLRTTDPVEIARAVLGKFWPFYEQFNLGRSIPDLVGTHLAHVGETVEVRVGRDPPWKGTVEGLGRNGELLVRPHQVESGRRGRPEGRAALVVALTGGEVVYGNPE
jgi:BirA family biotin operon repressor/biotin-[acetyl-CoA-carboxylase] ligase